MEINPTQGTGLAAGESTRPFQPIGGMGYQTVVMTVFGDLDGETLTLEQLNPHDSGWDAAYVAGSAQTYAGSTPHTDVYTISNEFSFRWTLSNGGGTPTGVFIHVSGAKFTD